MSAASAEPQHHRVLIEGMQFSPQVLEVRVGDAVTWVNKDLFPHNAVALGGGFSSKEIAADDSWEFKAAKKGAFPYICTLHPTMKATLIVK